jgi:hypothetical protein
MKAVYALYKNPNNAQHAVDELRKAGIAERDITILSSEPLEEYEFGQRDRQTWMTWLADVRHTANVADPDGRHADRHQLDESHRDL